MNKYSILLYSKYSTHSKQLLDIIGTSTIDFKTIVNLTTLCVDSKVVRERIKNNKLNVKYVPCILTIYNNGVVEKYDGINAFNWVDDIIKQLTPAKPVLPPPKPIVMINKVEDEYADNEEEDEEEDEEIVPKKVIIKSKKKMSRNRVTKIDDLLDIDDDSDRMINKKKSLRLKDKGNYEAENDTFNDERAVDVTTASKAIRPENSPGANTLNKAKELAKMRESDIANDNTKIKPPRVVTEN